jgi:glycosyltransferase involved in cell wall biosynthesis
MRLYAEQLGSHLEGRGLAVQRVRTSYAGGGRPGGPLVSGRLGSLWCRFVRAPGALKGLRADVVHLVDHAHGHLVGAAGPGRTVVSCHDLILLLLAAGRLRTAHRDRLGTASFRYSTSFLSRAAAVIADSERTARDALELLQLDPARVHVIAPGLNGNFEQARDDREATRARLGWVTPVLLHVGHTDFYKNLEGCLAVLARVRRRGIEARFVHVGAPLRPRQRALGEHLGVLRHVQEVGHVPFEILRAIYGAADVLLFPSWYEGFGWPPLEAMASGLPVVCSNAGALPELVGDAARTAAPEDMDGLADAVGEVLGDPRLAADLRARGVQRAASFRWESTAARVADVYDSVRAGA